MNSNGPRIIIWDLETLPDPDEVMTVYPKLSDYPGLTLKATITSIICFGYKVLGEKETHCINAWDFKTRWRKNMNDDEAICKAAYKILKDADAVVTHNGIRFDWKFLQTRLLKHKLPPLPKILHIDTCSVAKANLLAFNNRLNTMAELLTDDKKLENGGWDLWKRVSKKDPASMKLMTEYCKHDVVVLEKVFNKLRPFIINIPNHNLYTDGIHRSCPNCGSVNLKKDGVRVRRSSINQRWHCRSCYTYSQTSIKKDSIKLDSTLPK